MKNLALLALLLSVAGSSAYAESAVSESPVMTLALNSNPAVTWINAVQAESAGSINRDIELEVAKTIEKVSVALDKQLETKIAKEIEYAMQ